jgi:glycosyltransferase involved in cell wall biosynthesis
MTKILQISTGYDIGYNGGITNYVRNISEALIDAGHDVTVLYSRDSGSKIKYKFKTIVVNPKLRPFHLSSIISNSDIEKLEKIIINEKPHVIHVHMMIDLPIKILEMFKKHAKLVISLHDYSFICNRIVLIKSNGKNCVDSNENNDCNSCIQKQETIDNKYLRVLSREFKNIFFKDKLFKSKGHHKKFLVGKEEFKNADAIIAVSNRVKEIYEKNGFINKRFVVNHIGNNTAEDQFRELFKNRRNIHKGEKIKFGFIGNLVFIKGANIFIDLIENSSHEFHIYGGIEDNIKNKIEFKENVFYHGKYKHDNLPSILKNIDFGLVLPIWEDNAPQVVFEFLNAGIPILGTKMGGLPDFINFKNGKLVENSQSGIREAKQFINSDEIYDFYNLVLNKIAGTKKAGQHSDEMISLYNSL